MAATVTSADASGAWIVNAAQQQRFATFNEIIPLRHAAAPACGAAGANAQFVHRTQRLVRDCRAAHVWDSVKPAARSALLDLKAEGAATLLREIGTRLERRREFRIPGQSAGRSGAATGAPIAGVLYLNDEDRSRARCDRRNLSPLRGHLRPAVPMFAREIAAGLAFAESPPTRESLGCTAAA